MSLSRRTLGRKVAMAMVTVASAGLLAGMSTTTAFAEQVELTWWTWTPGVEPLVEMFEESHPNIKVNVVNAGQGATEYTKLRTAIKAGSGAPDIVALEYQYVPTFSRDLVDLNEYGADALKDKYVGWTWSQASSGGKLLGMPWDTAPMVIAYRADIFEEYGIEVPKTWDEFAEAARKLHDAAPDIYLTNLAANDPGQFLSMTAQAGSRPYEYDGGAKLKLNLNDAGAKKWADFWTPLVKDGVVSTDSAWNDGWYKGLAEGRYASWITAAWGPVFLQGTAKDTSGKWRAMLLPQWNEGENVSAAWGGTTYAVPKQSKHPEEAAEFAMWMSSSKEGTEFTAYNLFGFPSTLPLLSDPNYMDGEMEFFGGQQVAKVYAESTAAIDPSFQYSPFQDYVYSQMQTMLGKALAEKSDLAAAFDELQKTVTEYAVNQGFEVSH